MIFQVQIFHIILDYQGLVQKASEIVHNTN